jgi:hypothetical protein
VSPEDVEKLKVFGRQIARLSPEQIERRKWSAWTETDWRIVHEHHSVPATD